MKYSQYKYNFYLNASHSIYIDGKRGESHPHTWEITIYAINKNVDLVLFSDVEKIIEGLLDKYQEKYINDYEPFNTLNPTLENIAQYFLNEIQAALDDINWYVFTLEISETPTRSYIISMLENYVEEKATNQNIAEKIIERVYKNE